jgi:PAS domain S-box-containing protein
MVHSRAEDGFDERWFFAALGNISDAVIATDEQGRILFLNSAAETLTGWNRAESGGRPISDVFQIIDEDDREPLINPVNAVGECRQRISLHAHSLLISRNGKELPINGSATPVIEDDGRLKGVVMAFRDIAEWRRAELLIERLAAIVESSDDIIASTTLDGLLTSWNGGAERILGYSAEEVLGKHVSMLTPEEQVEDTETILSHMRRGEHVDHYQTKWQRKDGAIIDVSLTVSPIRDAEGRIVGTSKVGRDVTRQNDMQLISDRLAAIVESSDDIIASKDLEGVITSWNGGAERVLGYKAEEVIGRHVSMIMPPELVEDMPRILERIKRGERVDHYQTKRRRKDGTIIDVSLTVSPIRDGSGKIVGASKIGRDITQEKRNESERLESEQRKDEFLAMLAHELRNPLSAISGAAQLLGRVESAEDLTWAREVVLRQVGNLGRLIDDLLDVSRISRGKISLRKDVVDLSPIVSSVVESVRPLMEERKHELTVALVNGGLRLKADSLRLEQVLINLLTNAAKYTDAGGKISIEARRRGDEISIVVRDNGTGIEPELLPRVFDLFAQGDRSIARSEGGLGIGLTVVRKLVEMHGGTVSAASEGVGHGSEFTIRLPALAESAEPQLPERPKSPSGTRPGSRVLVVDDSIDNAKTLARILKLLGHDVRTAHDGQEAIEVAQRLRPELVLLDLGLPGMDGYEVARWLRKEDCCKGATIVAVTGYGQPEDQRRTREAGFDDHFVKPINYDDLVDLFAAPKSS